MRGLHSRTHVYTPSLAAAEAASGPAVIGDRIGGHLIGSGAMTIKVIAGCCKKRRLSKAPAEELFCEA